MEGSYRDGVLKPIFGFSLGTYLEFLDFALYASLTPIFAIKFFPSEYHDVSLIYSWGIFAISFMVRPFAGFIMGPIGDKVGINKIMIFSLALMGFATAAIGILPTYETIGLLAPTLLMVLRITQGFALSVEYGALSVYLSNIESIKEKFGFYSSFTSIAVLSGLLSGSILIGFILNNQATVDIPDWQWRAPFIICGILVGIFGSFFRIAMKSIYRHSTMSKKPLTTLAKYQCRDLFLLIVITGFVSLSSYIVLSYLANYLQIARNLYIKESLAICNLFGIPMLFAVPLGGWLSDKIGRISLIKTFSLSMIVVSVISISMVAYGNRFWISMGILILSINIGLLAGGIPALITENFHRNHRYTGITIAYNTATAWLGGTAPILITYFMSKTNNELIPGLYMSFFAALSFMSALLLNPNNNTSRRLI